MALVGRVAPSPAAGRGGRTARRYSRLLGIQVFTGAGLGQGKRDAPSAFCPLAWQWHPQQQVLIAGRQQHLHSSRKTDSNSPADVPRESHVQGILETTELAQTASPREPNNWCMSGIGMEQNMDGHRTSNATTS